MKSGATTASPLHSQQRLGLDSNDPYRTSLLHYKKMAPKETKFKVAAAHAAPVFMNKTATIKKTVHLIEQAAKDDIKLLVFPETFIPGYPVRAPAVNLKPRKSELVLIATIVLG
jgi:hypothetical protein